jgi:biofilm protein TabA
MILDSIDNAARHEARHAGFGTAFRFLGRSDVAALPVGRHAVDGDRVYAIVARDTGRGRSASPLESHRRYIDIQYVLAGNEVMGWKDLAACAGTGSGYSEEKDIEFFSGAPAKWFTVPPGSFAIFFPDDAHAPLAGEGPVHKIVVKVAVG